MKNLRNRLARYEREDGSIHLDSIREYLSHEDKGVSDSVVMEWVWRQIDKGLLGWVDSFTVHLAY